MNPAGVDLADVRAVHGERPDGCSISAPPERVIARGICSMPPAAFFAYVSGRLSHRVSISSLTLASVAEGLLATAGARVGAA